MLDFKRIDLVKGIGILLVVAGHIFSGEVSQAIYIFHMPLFFFLSGYLHKAGYGGKEYLHKKIKHLLVPYLAYLVLCYPVQLWMLILSHAWRTSLYVIAPILGGRFLIGPCAVFWFITCLFITQQAFNFLLNMKARWILPVAVLISWATATALSLFAPHFWLPFSANIALAALPMYSIGFFCKTRRVEIPLLVDLVLVVTSLFLLREGMHVSMDMRSGVYGIPLLTLVLALGWIDLVFKISNIDIPLPAITGCLSAVGKSSLVIMYLHQPIQVIMNKFGATDSWVRYITSILVSYAVYKFAEKYSSTRFWLIGS